MVDELAGTDVVAGAADTGDIEVFHRARLAKRSVVPPDGGGMP